MHRALIIVGLLVAGVAADAAQEIDAVTAAKVKAAYLYQLVKFVKWPGDAFEDEHAPIIIGVVGRDPFGALLDGMVANKKVSGRALVIRRITLSRSPDGPAPGEPPTAASNNGPDPYEAIAAELRGCHLLYISRSDEEGFPRILELLENAPVLTVSDISAFALDGGIVEFVLDAEKGTIGFHINHGVAKQAELHISSRVLNLADIVKSRPKKRA